MADDDFDAQLARDIRKNQEKLAKIEGQFEHIVQQSFADPAKANEAMEAMSKDQGESAVFHALRLEPHMFGNLPATEAAASKAEEQRRRLPEVFADYQKLRDATDELLTTQQMRTKAKDSGKSPESTPQSDAGASPAAEARRGLRRYLDQHKTRTPRPSASRSQQQEAEPEPGD